MCKKANSSRYLSDSLKNLLSASLVIAYTLFSFSTSFAFSDITRNYNTAKDETPGSYVSDTTNDGSTNWNRDFGYGVVAVNIVSGAAGKNSNDRSVIYRQWGDSARIIRPKYTDLGSGKPGTDHNVDAKLDIISGTKASYKANVFLSDFELNTVASFSIAATTKNSSGSVVGSERRNTLQFTSDGNIIGYVNNASTNVATSTEISSDFEKMQWYSVAAIIDGNTITYYVDGVQGQPISTTTTSGDRIFKVIPGFTMGTPRANSDDASVPHVGTPGWYLFDDVVMKHTLNGATSIYNPANSNTKFTKQTGAPIEITHPVLHTATPVASAEITNVPQGTTVATLLSYINPVSGGSVYAVKYTVTSTANFKAQTSSPANAFSTTNLSGSAIVDADTKIMSVSADGSLKMYSVKLGTGGSTPTPTPTSTPTSTPTETPAETPAQDGGSSDATINSAGIYTKSGITIQNVPDYTSVAGFLRQITTSSPTAKKEVIKDGSSQTYFMGVMRAGTAYTLRVTSFDETAITMHSISIGKVNKFTSNWNSSYPQNSGVIYSNVSGSESGDIPIGFSSVTGTGVVSSATTANSEGLIIENNASDIFKLKSISAAVSQPEEELVANFAVKQISGGEFVLENSFEKQDGAIDLPVLTIKNSRFCFNNEPIYACEDNIVYNVSIAMVHPKNTVNGIKVRKIWINGAPVLEDREIPVPEGEYSLSGLTAGVKGKYVLGGLNAESCGVYGYSTENKSTVAESRLYDIENFNGRYKRSVITGNFTTVLHLKDNILTPGSILVYNSNGSLASDGDYVTDGTRVEITTNGMKKSYYVSISGFYENNNIIGSIGALTGNTVVYKKSSSVKDNSSIIFAEYNGNFLESTSILTQAASSITLLNKANARVKIIYLNDTDSLIPLDEYDELN